MARLTARLQETQNSYPQPIALPDMEYATPPLREAFAAWRTAQAEAREASETLNSLDRDAKESGHRDGERWDRAQARVKTARTTVNETWAAIHGTIGAQRAQLLAHHAGARDAALVRLRAAAAELEDAATEYAVTEAWRQAVETGDLTARADRIPGLLALDGALHGESELDPTSGLALALAQLPVVQVPAGSR